MSTAGRATYQAAKGTAQTSAIKTGPVSGKDQIGQTKLKFRQIGQSSVEELKQQKQNNQQQQFKTNLEKKELQYVLGNNKETKWMVAAAAVAEEEEKKINVDELLQNKSNLIITPSNLQAIQEKYDDADIDFDSASSDHDDGGEGDEDDDNSWKGGKKGKAKEEDEFDSSDEDDDEDDDEAALQAELERIREERALAQARKEQEEREFQEKLALDQALRSNPLLSHENVSSKMKRRWNDDVIFRNQAKDEPEYKKRFINDTVRSDFHRAFLKRYIK